MKPLPLIDGTFFIDNSTIELLTTCPRAMQYAKLDKRIINLPNPAQNYGSAIHVGLETRYQLYKNRQPDAECLAAQHEAVAAYFEANPQPEDETRNLNWAVEQLKKYNEIYHTEPFNILVDKDGKPLIELSFALPLFTYGSPTLSTVVSGDVQIVYIGRIDLPVQWDGSTWIVDHKTATNLGDSYFNEKQMSAQQLGYCWAFQELTGQKVQGFCINAIRTRQLPAKPVGGVENWWRETLQRQRYNVTAEQLVEWKTNTIALVKEFFYHYEQDFFPQKTAWCSGKYGKCQYFGVCSYPADKRSTILASDEYKNNDWSPLKQNNQETK